MSYKQGKDRNAYYMTSLEMEIAEDNPVRIIDLLTRKFIEEEEIKRERKSELGNSSYTTNVFLNLYLYGYLHGIRSSRKLEREACLNIELHWLLERLVPDHWVINQFRKENEKLIKRYSRWFKHFLKSGGYIDGVRIVYDGTKIKAYASPDVWTEGKIEKQQTDIEQALSAYVSGLEKEDKAAEALLEAEAKIKSMEGKIAELESRKEQVGESGKIYYAPNDPEATLMKTRQGSVPAYNGQIGVDPLHHMIVSDYITDEANDWHQLQQNVEATKEQSGIEVEEVSADKGYANTDEILALEAEGKECYIPLPKTDMDKKKADGMEFSYNKEAEIYTCPAGEELVLKRKNFKQGNHYYNRYQATTNVCKNCKLRQYCTTSQRAKCIDRQVDAELIEGYKMRLCSGKAKGIIAQRKTVVEHPFGTIKIWMGKFGFLLTSKKKVETEFSLCCTAYNLRRLINISSLGELMLKVQLRAGERCALSA